MRLRLNRIFYEITEGVTFKKVYYTHASAIFFNY